MLSSVSHGKYKSKPQGAQFIPLGLTVAHKTCKNEKLILHMLLMAKQSGSAVLQRAKHSLSNSSPTLSLMPPRNVMQQFCS